MEALNGELKTIPHTLLYLSEFHCWQNIRSYLPVVLWLPVYRTATWFQLHFIALSDHAAEACCIACGESCRKRET